MTVDDLNEYGQKTPALQWRRNELGDTDPALIQYTSGSTDQPKGVLLSHANLLANIRAVVDRLEVKPNDVVVSWLPLYHDMGLIGAWLGSLYVGAPLAVMSPITFLARPAPVAMVTPCSQSNGFSRTELCLRPLRTPHQ